MPLIQLETATDPRVADYVALSDAALRQRTDPARGLYIAEGSKVLRRALAAGHVPRSFFLAEKWVDALADVLAEHTDVPAFVGAPGVLDEVAGYPVHRGALAAMNRPAPGTLAGVLAGARRVAVLEDMVDHVNLGAIFRSAAALGIDAVLLTPRAADPLYRRAVKVSMGAVFQVPWARFDSWPGGLVELREAGFHIAALELTDDASTITELAAAGHVKLAVVLGTEGDGVSAAALDAADEAVLIPMRPGVDSLNVAAASAVAFWELRVY